MTQEISHTKDALGVCVCVCREAVSLAAMNAGVLKVGAPADSYT